MITILSRNGLWCMVYDVQYRTQKLEAIITEVFHWSELHTNFQLEAFKIWVSSEVQLRFHWYLQGIFCLVSPKSGELLGSFKVVLPWRCCVGRVGTRVSYNNHIMSQCISVNILSFYFTVYYA